MNTALRRLALVALIPLGACNVQITSPDENDYGNGSTRLPAPTGLWSLSLDAAVQLSWSGWVVSSYPNQFRHYRVYSTNYFSGSNRCDDVWVVEGTTVSDSFLVGNLRSSVTRCFSVATVANDGGEGPRSNAIIDRPR